MSTIRVSKDRNYSVINNTVLNDKRLSWKAKGLAAYLLSKPDDWKIIREHLVKQSDDGETSVRTGLQELEECGYLVRTRHQNELGQFEWEHVLHETPIEVPSTNTPPSDENPHVENPPVDKSPVENHVLLSTKVVSTEVVNTKAASATPAPSLAKPILEAFVVAKKEREPGCVINYPAEMKAAKAIAKEGWTPEQVVECTRILYADAFYSKSSLSLWSVAKQIGAKVRRVSSAAATPVVVPSALFMEYAIKESDRYVPN